MPNTCTLVSGGSPTNHCRIASTDAPDLAHLLQRPVTEPLDEDPVRRSMSSSVTSGTVEWANRRNAVIYSHPTEGPCCHTLGGQAPGAVEWYTDTARAILSVPGVDGCFIGPYVEIQKGVVVGTSRSTGPRRAQHAVV
jgi:hypothetical protein